ncbi:PLC-like phosphodiesterase [Lineolata rhizophorae]|uniref:PLC-like phosphodiesterase n=1 Tax=Lineolata rhizophorae TaxID=578093 RepID=A0A6A6NV92_9PEZI|nr:PLC-like phosphodiesterase [Lineolata rhizophorae]
MRPEALSGLLCLLSSAWASPIPEVSSTLQNILDNTHQSGLYRYPTDFTRGIIPKPFHSHNDYWRDVPFYSALAYGATSVEADVWLYNGTLYVGHEESALTTERTLDSLYIQPILDTVRRQNPVTTFVPEPTRNGVYDTSSGQTLFLFIDLKTDGEETWPVVLDALNPLLSANYLTTYNGTDFGIGPVTIIGTGNTPLVAVEASEATAASPRYAFFDGPLADLDQEEFQNITRAVSPIASTAFGAQFGEVTSSGLNESSLDLLREQVSTAHDRGIMARYWDTPGFPIGTRNWVWRLLINEGVDFLNVDDLAGVASFWQMEGW